MRAAVTDGPFDADELDLDVTDGVGRLDFGAVRVPMPPNAQLQIDPIPGGHLRAVHVLVPQGRLSLSALAAPRSSGLWRSLSAEIAESLRREGAEVRSVRGVWGREVAAGAKGALSRFIGVDGSRWMLYGVAAGPAEDADELARTLRAMIKGTVVVRGPEPYPVKTVLPLRVPAHLEAQLVAIRAAEEVEPAPEPAPMARDEYPLPDEYSPPAPVAPAPVAPAPVAPAPRREVAPARLVADDAWAVRDWAARELDEVERRLAHRDWAARELDQVEQDRAVRERELAGEPTAPFPAPVTAPIPQLSILEQPISEPAASEPPAFEPAATEPPAFEPPAFRGVDEPSRTAASDPITEPLKVLPPTAPPTTAQQPAARQAADVSDELETPRAWLAPQPEPAWPPVVTEPELSQVPAWAALAAAPQFWLDEHPGKHRAAGEDPKPGPRRGRPGTPNAGA